MTLQFKPLELHTEKKYCAYLERTQHTPGRAGRVIEYLREHLRTAKKVELWNIRQDNELTHRIRSVRVAPDTLTETDIKDLSETEAWQEPVTHFCYLLTRTAEER